MANSPWISSDCTAQPSHLVPVTRNSWIITDLTTVDITAEEDVGNATYWSLCCDISSLTLSKVHLTRILQSRAIHATHSTPTCTWCTPAHLGAHTYSTYKAPIQPPTCMHTPSIHTRTHTHAHTHMHTHTHTHTHTCTHTHTHAHTHTQTHKHTTHTQSCLLTWEMLKRGMRLTKVHSSFFFTSSKASTRCLSK